MRNVKLNMLPLDTKNILTKDQMKVIKGGDGIHPPTQPPLYCVVCVPGQPCIVSHTPDPAVVCPQAS